MPPILFHFTGQEQLQSPGFYPVSAQKPSAPTTERSTAPRLTFLSLPREVRQNILLLAVESSMIRCYTLSRVSRKSAISGFWDDLNYAAHKMITSLKMLDEQEIFGDLDWVLRTSSDTLRIKQLTDLDLVKEGTSLANRLRAPI
ncbi:Geranylgeranyl pyrophosphate synthase [Venturia inaequalis]|nr:Geranylgeranyl pyrophosphate synthase [Venturia inaequalis]